MKKIAFTIVLNGMPFIRQQAEIIPKIFDEWHIIEGATLPVNDTYWCKNINSIFYSDDKLSIDGTSEFIDSIIDNTNIFVHRKYDFWNGKVEMCNSIKTSLSDCILMQIDVDEFWKADTLLEIFDYSKDMSYDGIHFKCNYFVGPDLMIQNDGCYGNRDGEWSRLWKINKPTEWISHEPPRLKGLTNFLSRNSTKNMGWVFDHYAYVYEHQLKFKENFYGYMNATDHWKKLQNSESFPCLLKDYLPWVKDNSVVDRIK
jgi:hypothetical protein